LRKRHGERSVSTNSALQKNIYVYPSNKELREKVQQIAMHLFVISHYKKEECRAVKSGMATTLSIP
jgi:hypothetical protein